MYFFELHHLSKRKDHAIVYEIVEAPVDLIKTALAHFTGQSFPTSFGHLKIQETVQKGSLWKTRGRLFGKVWTDAPPERVAELMVDAFGGAADDYGELHKPSPVPDDEKGPLFHVRKMAPVSQSVELAGRTFADTPLRDETQMTAKQDDGSSGTLFRHKGETFFVVLDPAGRFRSLLTRTDDIAEWLSGIATSEYSGMLDFQIDMSRFAPGHQRALRADKKDGDPDPDADEVRTEAKTLDITSALEGRGLGFVLPDGAAFDLPAREERLVSLAETTAIAAASRDGILLPHLDRFVAKISTEVHMLELANLYPDPPP